MGKRMSETSDSGESGAGQGGAPQPRRPPVLHASRLFPTWLKSARASLVFSTYQAGKLFMIGLRDDGRLSVFERTFERCMGLGVSDRGLWVSSLYQLWRFENFLGPGEQKDGYDACYVPLTGHTTGDIDIHDIHQGADGRPIFVATRFNCLATLDPTHSFEPVWTPPFIDRLAAEDRCHLNGAAFEAGAPRYVTCVAPSNIAEGWRDRRRDGGVVIDVATGETVLAGLSMPHSPRLHNGVLWMIQSGTGEFGWVDREAGRFEPICFCPGFARGLAFLGDYAIIGLSRPRENRTFDGLVLNERLAAEGAEAKCALLIVNLKTGEMEHRLELEGFIEELYDIAVLPGIIRPMALGFKSDEIRYYVRPKLK